MLLPFFDSKMNELLNRIGTPYDPSISLEQNLAIDPYEFFISEKGEIIIDDQSPKLMINDLKLTNKLE